MKITKRFWYYSPALIGAAFMLFSSCEKENIPVLSTTEVTGISQTTAISGGNITDDGDATVTARGVCWCTSQNPVISDSKTEDGNGTGSFTSSITGLEPNTAYYVRAYATNSEGTGYGAQISFETTGIIYGDGVTDIDGNEYATVIIGNYEWMAENLKTTRYNIGTDIPNITGNGDWMGLITGAYCWYDNDESTYKDTYGALYNWYAVATGNLCPAGWRVPTDDEWKNLEGTVDSQYDVGDPVWDGEGWRGYDTGTKLKATSGWNSGGNGTNDFGFSALPGGLRAIVGSYGYLGYYGYWWSSNQYSTAYAWHRDLGYDFSNVIRLYEYKEFGFSVRCVRD